MRGERVGNNSGGPTTERYGKDLAPASPGRRLALDPVNVPCYNCLVTPGKPPAGTMDDFQIWIARTIDEFQVLIASASPLDTRITDGDILVYAVTGFVVLALAKGILARIRSRADKKRLAWGRQHVDPEDDRNNSR